MLHAPFSFAAGSHLPFPQIRPSIKHAYTYLATLMSSQFSHTLSNIAKK